MQQDTGLQRGVSYKPAELTRSELHIEAVPLFSSGRVRLLDQPHLLTQLKALERRAARGGHEVIEHPPGGYDDASNGACGALVLAARRPEPGTKVLRLNPEPGDRYRYMPGVKQ